MTGEVVAGGFKQSRTVNDDLQREIKAAIYSKVDLLSVAEVLGILRIVELELFDDQRE